MTNVYSKQIKTIFCLEFLISMYVSTAYSLCLYKYLIYDVNTFLLLFVFKSYKITTYSFDIITCAWDMFFQKQCENYIKLIQFVYKYFVWDIFFSKSVFKH